MPSPVRPSARCEFVSAIPSLTNSARLVEDRERILAFCDSDGSRTAAYDILNELYDELRAHNGTYSQAHYAPPSLTFRPGLLEDEAAMRQALEQHLVDATSGYYGGPNEAQADLLVFKTLYLDDLSSKQVAALYLGVTHKFDASLNYLLYIGLIRDATPMADRILLLPHTTRSPALMVR